MIRTLQETKHVAGYLMARVGRLNRIKSSIHQRKWAQYIFLTKKKIRF